MKKDRIDRIGRNTAKTLLFVIVLAAIAINASVASDSRPGIYFTYIPPYGSHNELQGKVTNVNPADYKVAVYIYVSGWWTKPYFDSPLTFINNDGSWTCNIVTGGSDQDATRVKAYLVPNGYNPPQMSGQQIFPAELENNSVASVEASKRPDRHITFSGRDWIVKYSAIPEGPGLNYFSDSDQSVFVDDQGRLHLKIINVGGTWYSSEVILNESLGYGRYVFYADSRIDQLDQNVVLGMFTWDTAAPANNYREIDIEFSKFGNAADTTNAQFVVQPWNRAGNRYRFDANLSITSSINAFRWSAENVNFLSLQGENLNTVDPADIISSWVYSGGDIPPPGNENARINLWLFDPNNVLGRPPSDGKEAEVIISKFEFRYLNGTIATPVPTPTPTLTPTSTPSPIATSSSSGSGDSGSSSGSSNGGGGGGVPSSPENFSNVKKTSQGSVWVYKGKAMRINFTNLSFLKEAGFISRGNDGDIGFIGQLLYGKPKDATESSGSNPVYFDIWIGTSGYSSSSNIADRYVLFNMPDTFKDDVANIKLFNFKNRVWQEVNYETTGNGAYKALVPGFGSFALTEIEPVTPVPTASQETVTEAVPIVTPQPTTAAVKSTPGLSAGLGIATLFAAALICLWKRKN